MTFIRRAVTAAAAAAAVLVTSASFALATDEQQSYIAADGTIQGCVNSSGNLRLVEAGSACRPDERSVTWAQKGEQGPADRRASRDPPDRRGTPEHRGRRDRPVSRETPGRRARPGRPDPQGRRDPPDPPGLAGVHVVTVRKDVGVLDMVDVDATCPDGEIATGGGWYLPNGAAQSYGPALHSNPILSGTTPVGWTAGFTNGGYEPHLTASVYAICAKTG